LDYCIRRSLRGFSVESVNSPEVKGLPESLFVCGGGHDGVVVEVAVLELGEVGEGDHEGLGEEAGVLGAGAGRVDALVQQEGVAAGEGVCVSGGAYWRGPGT
jgi:hypothetical protein